MLRKFKFDIVQDERHGELELLSFHSCSMSGLEVAAELEGTAKYILASQGPALVGSWPYRQILLRVFNDLSSPKTKIFLDRISLLPIDSLSLPSFTAH